MSTFGVIKTILDTMYDQTTELAVATLKEGFVKLDSFFVQLALMDSCRLMVSRSVLIDGYDY